MGDTDYKDPDWTEKDLQELHEAGLEGQRRAALYNSGPEGRLKWRAERAAREAEFLKNQEKYARSPESRAWLEDYKKQLAERDRTEKITEAEMQQSEAMENEKKVQIAKHLMKELATRFREMTRESQATLIWVYKQQEPTLEGDEKLGCQRLIRMYDHIHNGEPAQPFRVPESLKWNALGLRERENIVKLVRGMYRDGLVTEEVLQEYQRLLGDSREKLLKIPAHPGRPS